MKYVLISLDKTDNSSRKFVEFNAAICPVRSEHINFSKSLLIKLQSHVNSHKYDFNTKMHKTKLSLGAIRATNTER